MANRIPDAKREQHLLWDIHEALALPEAQEGLRQLIPMFMGLIRADHLVVCYPSPGPLPAYEWIPDSPEMLAYFQGYAEMASDDFLRETSERFPNQVLRDQDVMPHPRVRETVLYRRAQELKMPLKRAIWTRGQDEGSTWHWGLIGYREDMRAFSERERAKLDGLRASIHGIIGSLRDLALKGARSVQWNGEGSLPTDRLPPRIHAQLTPRQRDVLLRVLQGHTHKEIGGGDKKGGPSQRVMHEIRKRLKCDSQKDLLRLIEREWILHPR